MSITLERIEMFHIAMPLLAPFETSFGVTTERHTLLVKAITRDGVVG